MADVRSETLSPSCRRCRQLIDQIEAAPLDDPTRGHVVRLDQHPERRDFEVARKAEKETERAHRVALSPMLRIDRVSQLPQGARDRRILCVSDVDPANTQIVRAAMNGEAILGGSREELQAGRASSDIRRAQEADGPELDHVVNEGNARREVE